jgi:hypothetical protein
MKYRLCAASKTIRFMVRVKRFVRVMDGARAPPSSRQRDETLVDSLVVEVSS